MRKPIVAGNWKMNLVPSTSGVLAADVALALGAQTADPPGEGPEVVVCPPFPALVSVGSSLQGSGVTLGAQDVHWEREGAFTGEVSVDMLVDLGCRYVIIGHSERRAFGESDEQVARKTRTALQAGLTPIVCVGETWQERQQNETEDKVGFQVMAATALLEQAQVSRLVFAYEPIWAIGTGRHADGETAQQVARLIRSRLQERFGEAAERLRIQYGGSVKPDNIADFAGQADIDGALVGGASLQADSFAAIVAGFG